MPWVITGSTSAAASNPTTAAFTPASARRTGRWWRNVCQCGNTATTSSAEGRKIATKAINAPVMPDGGTALAAPRDRKSEEHTSELQSRGHLVCRLLLEKKNKITEAIKK